MVVKGNNVFLIWHVYLQQLLNIEEPNTDCISAPSTFDKVYYTITKSKIMNAKVYCVFMQAYFGAEHKEKDWTIDQT